MSLKRCEGEEDLKKKNKIECMVEWRNNKDNWVEELMFLDMMEGGKNGIWRSIEEWKRWLRV